MSKNETPPVISETAFSCPHCGAYTTQHWFQIHAKPLEEKSPTPFIPVEANKKNFLSDPEIPQETKEHLVQWLDQMMTGLPFFEDHDGKYVYKDINNLHISECYNCKKLSVWIHDRLVFPPHTTEVTANSDMPSGIKRDFEEARSILDSSPRGSAALLRLCVQKLCIHLGEKGKNIDDDIASLVSKGLDPLVQQSLDIVRVIGNESVHPGVIDLNDNRDDAIQLFHLLNAICDQMISHPQKVKDLYSKLPEAKRKAIEARNAKTQKK